MSTHARLWAVLLLLCVICCGFGAAVPSQKDTTFRQSLSIRMTYGASQVTPDWPSLPLSASGGCKNGVPVQVLGEPSTPSTAYLLCSDGLWLLQGLHDPSLVRVDTALGLSITPGSQLAWCPSFSSLLVALPTQLCLCGDSCTCSPVTPALGGAVAGAVCTASGYVFVAAQGGLFSWNGQPQASPVLLSEVTAGNLTSIAWDEEQGLAVGSATSLWRHLPAGLTTKRHAPGTRLVSVVLNDGDHDLPSPRPRAAQLNGWRHDWVGAIIDQPITALTFDGQGRLWIGNAWSVSVMHPDFRLQRLGAQQGLPVDHITSLASTKDGVWIGSAFGMALWHADSSYCVGPLDPPPVPDQNPAQGDVSTPCWQFFNGPRWLSVTPAQSSSAITALSAGHSSEGVWVSTAAGLAHVLLQDGWTLAQKAQLYEETVFPRHDRYGMVADCPLRNFGDLNSWYPSSHDNDGLWTSLYVAAESFRYAVTKDPQAKANAVRSFQALRRLVTITGVRGLPARSLCQASDENCVSSGGTWHNSTVEPGWIWKGDTSSDEICGHIAGYLLFHELVAESAEERQQSASVLVDIVRNIQDHGYYLIDVTGKPTRWGVWAPDPINNDISWYSERGLNSLQMLSMLLAAAHMDPGNSTEFLQGFEQLSTQFQYDLNMINAKADMPTDVDASDDELNFLNALVYAMTDGTTNDHMHKVFLQSVERSWNFIRDSRTSLYTFLYYMMVQGRQGATLTSQQEDVFYGIQELRRWPTSLITWTTDNTNRIDYHLDPYLYREKDKDATRAFAVDERPCIWWNCNLKALSGGNDFSERAPSAYLLAYWAARFGGFVE